MLQSSAGLLPLPFAPVNKGPLVNRAMMNQILPGPPTIFPTTLVLVHVMHHSMGLVDPVNIETVMVPVV